MSKITKITTYSGSNVYFDVYSPERSVRFVKGPYGKESNFYIVGTDNIDIALVEIQKYNKIKKS